jgi:S-adenosylmethionine-diacylglycerol 3-amino-3-carboxypropyl transferase
MSGRPASYFRGQLNYTLGDEDADVERSVLREGAGHVVTVAGSGSRALPLLSRAPAKLTFLDVSPPQLHLTELRVAAARALSRDEFVAFLGYPPASMSPTRREQSFRKLELSPPARSFFEGLFEAHAWGSLLYLGRFERMLQQLAFVNRLFTGSAGRGLFDARSREEQRAYLASSFPHRAFKAVLLLLGNSAILNSLLYKGDFPEKNVPGSAYDVYKGVFYRLFEGSAARESFFLQMVFFGELRFAEGNPLECDPEVYAQAQRALERTEVSFTCADVLEAVGAMRGTAELVCLSDVPTFLKGSREASCLQDLRAGLAPGAMVVTRGHLRVSHPDATGFEVITEAYEAALNREKTQLWKVQIYRFKG